MTSGAPRSKPSRRPRQAEPNSVAFTTVVSGEVWCDGSTETIGAQMELLVLAAIAIPFSTLVMQTLSKESDDEFDFL